MPGQPTVPGQAMPGMQQRQAPVNVSAKDDTFDPANITIQPGQTVRFTNSGNRVHTVTSTDNKFDSGDIPPGRAFDVTFMSEGTYKYHCKHHKGMEGTITVKAAKSGSGGAKVGGE
jgi:plastocyanin